MKLAEYGDTRRLLRGRMVSCAPVGNRRRAAIGKGRQAGYQPAAGCQRDDTVQTMKVYFGFTVAGDRSALEMARRTVALLEEMGHEVLTRHLVRDDAAQLDRAITPRMVFERDMNWLRQCDIFIGEVSGSSFGIGFEAGYLLGGSARQALLFYRREVESRISLLITGNTHPNCTLAPYSEFAQIEDQLRRTMA
jgi:nucleoside 2-deoxyribosyltransferase